MGLDGGLLTQMRVGLGAARRMPASSNAARMRNARAGLALPLFDRLPQVRTMGVDVALGRGIINRFIIEHISDLLVLNEVFGEGQYIEPALHEPRLIIDAGAHIGASAAYFATRYPEARVIALEASTRTFERLRHNTRSLPNVEVWNVALGSSDGSATFYERVAAWSSSLEAGTDAVRSFRVPMLTLDSVVERSGADHVDLLKIDVEGAEYDIFAACPPDPSRLAAIVGELHTWMPEVSFSDAEFFELLRGYSIEDDHSGGDRVFRAVADPPSPRT